MEKITLKLGEILQLESEINGLENPETKEVIYHGFLKQNLPVILKYELKELSEKLKKERETVDSIRVDLIKKYGEKSESGDVYVKMFDDVRDEEGNLIDRKYTQSYMDFDAEYSKLLNKEKEFEYNEITKEDLKEAGKTTDNYEILFKLIKKELN